jgi:hypothetical protein
VSVRLLIGKINTGVEMGDVFYTDQFKSHKLARFYGKDQMVHRANKFNKGTYHINGLEGFWSYTEESFLKYHGLIKSFLSLLERNDIHLQL